jgi:flagella basal body P-ring formation protein FlgA
MKRLTALFAGAAIFLAFSAQAAEKMQAAPALLKNSASINHEHILLGDIFENIGAKANVPVAYAPQPGKRQTYDARWLAVVASANSVDWKPSSVYDRIVVDRPSQTVSKSEIETELMNALVTQYGLPETVSLELTARNLQIHIPVDVKPTIAVYDLAYDERARRFTATIETPAGSPNASRARLSGRIFHMVEIPVPVRNLSKGDTVSAKDVKWAQVRQDDLRGDMATEMNQIVGQSPRGLLRPGQPVRLSDLTRPITVGKNSLVTMIYKVANMTITTQGKAIDEGGPGDTVRVLNTTSNTTVEAVVRNNNTVIVSSAINHLLATN